MTLRYEVSASRSFCPSWEIVNTNQVKSEDDVKVMPGKEANPQVMGSAWDYLRPAENWQGRPGTRVRQGGTALRC